MGKQSPRREGVGTNRRQMMAGTGAALAATTMARAETASSLDARAIITRTHAAAGAGWIRPSTLVLTGKATFWPKGTQASAIVVPDYRMWRAYPSASADAHVANGMVRIDARLPDGRLYYQIAYDGVDTFNEKGPIAGAVALKEWSENFGFGIIRFALNDGFALERLPDDEADGRPMYVVEVRDSSGGVTRFGIAQDDYQILWLGFQTPKGWHERRYSHFYRNPGVAFTQPGRVRLFYNGVKQNEVWWTAYQLGRQLPFDLFRLRAAP